MILKSPTEKTVQVALLSGHCIVVGPEGREIPQMFLSDAFKNGCIPVEVDAKELKVEAPPHSIDHKEIIINAIKKMLEDGCQLTGAGLPNRKDLSAATGFPVSSVDLSEAWQVIESELK